jgi:hypothetical protein
MSVFIREQHFQNEGAFDLHAHLTSTLGTYAAANTLMSWESKPSSTGFTP